MMISNPFQPTKFEWEKRPIIWLSSRAKNLITSIKPTYVSGSRGSGKTTILRSLSTRQLSIDPFLRSQHRKGRLTWYGQYLQFNSTLQEKTDKLAEILKEEGEPDEVVFKLFHAYFEITLLYHFLNDLNFFQDNQFLHFKAQAERTACEELMAILGKSRWAHGKKVDNFQDARRLLREIQQEFLKTPGSIDHEGLREVINIFQAGTLVRFIKEHALPAIESGQFSRSQELDLFILLDDCENLSGRQQVALNSYIRITEGVAKWVISFLSDRYNTTETYLKETTLGNEDRIPLPLNEMPESHFVEFCEQVTNLRLEKFLDGLDIRRKEPNGRFSFKSTFGDFSYNLLLSEVIKSSRNQRLAEFQRAVMSTKGTLALHIKKALHNRFSCEKDQTPYIEHVVIEALGLQIARYDMPEEQLSLSKTIDGKQAAAYIGLCAQYNLRPLYAGRTYFKAISDNCIRDYLDAVARLFDVLANASGRALTPNTANRVANQFLATTGRPIGFKTQDRAIQEVSESKFQSLEQLKMSEPHIVRLVLALSFLQQSFEHDTENWEAVKYSVRGKYIVELPKGEPDGDGAFSLRSIRSILERLEYDRYIKIIRTSDSELGHEMVFALHRRLRPYRRCGHSGPYDPLIPVSANWLLEALNGPETFSAEAWADRYYKYITSQDGHSASQQGELPL